MNKYSILITYASFLDKINIPLIACRLINDDNLTQTSHCDCIIDVRDMVYIMENIIRNICMNTYYIKLIHYRHASVSLPMSTQQSIYLCIGLI